MNCMLQNKKIIPVRIAPRPSQNLLITMDPCSGLDTTVPSREGRPKEEK